MSDDPRWVRIDAVATQLDVTVGTVRYWLRRGLVPAHCYCKIGQTYRFDMEALLIAFRPQPRVAAVDEEQLPLQLEEPVPAPEHRPFRLEDIFPTEGDSE
jgi:hypothetical protein